MLRKILNKTPPVIKNTLKRVYFKNKKIIPKTKTKTKLKSQKTVIVLGMHRTGTSLTSNILTELGFNMGDLRDDWPTDFNAKGNFENEVFLSLNNKILSFAGGDWQNPPKKNSILSLKKNKRLMYEIKKVIDSQKSEFWGWKDPRTALTIELYLKYLDNPHFIICYRNPLATAESLKRQQEKIGGISLEKALKLTSAYNLRIADFLSKKNYPVLIIQYEDYFKDKESQISKIKKFLNINKKISDDLVDKKLKHF